VAHFVGQRKHVVERAKFISMYGCTPYTGAEYAPLRLPSFSYTSIQRSRNPRHIRDW
jgi:hypothetical protein